MRFLEELTAKAQRDGKLKKEQIKEALHRIVDFLNILEDNRATKQGSEDWHFKLKLWYRRHDKEAILRQFDVEWERRRSEKSKQLTGEESKETVPETPPTRKALDNHPNNRPKPVDVLEVPEGPVALSSAFYVDRPPAAALKQVVTVTEPVRLETMQAYKLYSMGLIKRQGDRVTPRCQLYQQYFQERLRN